MIYGLTPGLILIVGGFFLIAKSTHEIHQKLEGEEGRSSSYVPPTFTSVIVQILCSTLFFPGFSHQGRRQG